MSRYRRFDTIKQLFHEKHMKISHEKRHVWAGAQNEHYILDENMTLHLNFNTGNFVQIQLKNI